ncbi:hypothetical protein QJS04_geneDACA012916 [Acorus gramineus]|uniref:Uncharacterized protein n=1 Tax=Acorus gramineus TaxID=55184 RepID=A0AAV9B1A5_ACOGR|nr:hypothetical protein QJS04_geneDACA012916 [Acorus gramineus]
MGAQKSIHAGKARIDVNVDLTHKLCAALMPPSLLRRSGLFSEVIARLCIKHPNLFGRSEKLDVMWDKGLCDSNLLITFRRPRSLSLSQQSFVVQHSITPEIGVLGVPLEGFTHSGGCGINLRRFSMGVDFSEPPSSHWSSTTSVKLEHISPINDEGRPIDRDLDGFLVTCSGNSHDNMVVLKQEAQYAIADERSFTRLNFQIDQGLPVLSKWLIFNRVKLVISKGVKLGPAFLVTR